MESNSSVVIVSSSNTKPKSLVKLITKCLKLDETDPEAVWTKWNISTKYYKADVNVIGISKKYVRTDDFNANVEALVIHMDSNKENGLKDLEEWTVIDDDCCPEVKLLIANYCNDETKVRKTDAVNWCLKRGFEFIELYPSPENPEEAPEDEDNIIVERKGVERVIEALLTHSWPNLVLTSDTKGGFSHDAASSAFESESTASEDAVDDFSELLSQLHMVRGSLNSLPSGQRKQCAEQMVTAIWKAIGGDEEEISDI